MTSFAADALADDAVVTATDEQINTIAELAELQLALEFEIVGFEADLKNRKEALKKVQEVQLPEAMAQAGVSEFKLLNGAKISIKEDLSVSVPKSRMLEIADWLRKNGLGDILKETMVISLEDQAVKNIIEMVMKEYSLTGDAKLDVNTSTLKAVLREQIAEGKDIDLKFFGGYAWKRAMITAPTS